MSLYDRFLAFDAQLAATGIPPLTAWWREHLRRWFDRYERDPRVELWAACGRGSSKTTVLRKLLLFFSVVVDFAIPPGERHWALLVSARAGQAKESIDVCSSWLTLLGLPHTPYGGDTVEIGASRGIRVTSANVVQTSGWRAYAVFVDEHAKWSTTESAMVLNADQILASAKATTVTHRDAPIAVFSSPWGDENSFALTVLAGDSDAVCVLGPVATWEAMAGLITETDTRKMERHGATWEREYACRFLPTFTASYFDEDDIAACIDASNDGEQSRAGAASYIVAIDAAFKVDLFVCAVAHAELRDGRRLIVIDQVRTWPRGTPPYLVIPDVVTLRGRYGGSRAIYGDQYHAASLAELFQRHHCALIEQPWSAVSKIEHYRLMQRLLHDRAISLPNHAGLLRELRGIGTKLQPSGIETISYKGSDDCVSAAVIAVVNAYDQAPMTAHTGNPFWVGRPALQSVSAPNTASASEGDERFTRSTHCNECGELRGSCPHTEQHASSGGHRDYWGNAIRPAATSDGVSGVRLRGGDGW